MKNVPLKKTVSVVGLAIALALGNTADANIQQQVNAMFNSMINVTAPGAYKTASMGVVTGGNIVIRNRITTITPIHITPPSAKGGCGGINMYMGSFSFINAEEFIGLMRNIAANAVGVASAFAFNLAIEAMDSMTSGVITKLRDAMQLMNQAMLNSCNIATGVVSGTYDAFKESRDLKAAAKGVAENIVDDMFASRRSNSGGNPVQRLISAGKASPCSDTGNILWCAMQKTNFTNQFLYGSQENAELIMSMVGSYIIGTGSDSEGKETFIPKAIPPLPNIDLALLVEGSSGAAASGLQIYECDLPDCVEPQQKAVGELQGLASKIVQSIRTANLFERIKAGQQVSDAEQNAHDWLFSSDVGGFARRLIDLHNPDVAYEYVNRHSKAIALNTLKALLTSQIAIVRGGLKDLEMIDREKVEADLDRFERNLHMEADALLRTRYASTDPVGDYIKLRDAAKQRDSSTVSHGTNLTGTN